MGNVEKKQAGIVGRPRAFDTDKALDCALDVFWRKGYEGASLPDLTEAMGINKPSLYAAFGNKEALFHKALERYADGPAAYVSDVLNEPTAHAVAEGLLKGAVRLLSDPANPRGCLVVQGALAAGDECESIKLALDAKRKAGEAAIRKRLERAQREGDLPKESSPAALARYLCVVVHGMAVQAAGGASRKELKEMVGLAMLAWPRQD